MTAPSRTAVPAPPQKPDPMECCERGCCPCIFDYYWDALDRWKATVRALGHDPEQLLALRTGD
jgi:hypothetical protein